MVPELSVAGFSPESIAKAFELGADSVHVGLEGFSLGVASGLISMDQAIALQKGRNVFCSLDRFFHNEELKSLDACLSLIPEGSFSGFIVSDIGAAEVVKKYFSSAKLILSPFANCTNSESAKVFASIGFDRLILGPETSFDDIERICKSTDSVEFEIQIHGSRCMSYSGRSLLSTHLGREAVEDTYALEEEQRAGVFFPIREQNGFITIMSSETINLADEVGKLISLGITVFRSESRDFSEAYLFQDIPKLRASLNSIGFLQF